MSKLSVLDLSLSGKRVLLRVDFNVPTEEREGLTHITDDNRIKESLPTIQHLRSAGAKVILMAHFGRPKGSVNLKYTLRPVAQHLSHLIDSPVAFS
ncbi:MAG: phosphoglycerate kinase, partial [Chthoniobacteraceae bacterium]|nr:phosphoglycerate kinase [Chthoniobacteraceae bacterium]